MLFGNKPLLDKSEDNRNEHADSGGSVVDVPFSDLDDKSLRDTVEDI